MTHNKPTVTDPIKYELLAQAMEDRGWNYEILASKTSIAEGTVKNILTGKTTHSSTQNVCALCDALDVPVDDVLGYSRKTALEVKGAKENDAAILALKEMYEFQIATTKENSEAHITNIRAHYEQHHDDLKENYEKRLADKREIIEVYQRQVEDLKVRNKKLVWVIAFFVLGVVTLLVLEFLHPAHGWLRF